MSGGFQGTPEQFTASEKHVTEVRVSMDQNLNTLRDNIEATAAGWGGEAATAFNNIMTKFDEDARGLNQALQRIGDLLQDAGSKYARTEAEQQEIMHSLNAGFHRLG
ncbi:WXG100 family type VII secretion target [Amycolatopsis sp. H20-H5]|uniref:WXG100 family type VII secretion target n=1 Tax=Amycolatopsis sp. H20-H5 TaxID=3046309 RepID=UPI002DB9003D|nr:WXG100 family type VII secretion target [Amycolatopsis sp. H20-H5]MEC3980222.1 WXG100 family type VII secretion target [Amycolatopsis sp. H20-H5]